MEQQSELLTYLKVISKRKTVIAAVALMCLIASVVATLTTEARYEATAQIIISQGLGIPGDKSSGDFYQALLLGEQVAKTFKEIIGGRILAERVISRLDLHMSTEDMREKVIASQVKDTQLIEIMITDSNPIAAKDIANTYAKEFVIMAKEVSPTSTAVNVKVVETAVVPSRPISPRPLFNAVFGLLVGIIMSLGVAFLLEMLDVTVKEQEEIETLLDLPALGKLPARDKPSLIRGNDVLASDAYRGVRTNLQYIDFNHSIKTLLVTSANRSEGKSTFSLNLATVFAQSGQKVLLIEADLRRPSQSTLVSLANYKGLSTVLAGSAKVESVLQDSGVAGLTVIMSGPIPPNPSDLLNSIKFTALIENLSNQFDIIIIDSPPVLPVTDTAILSTKVDAVLLLVHYGKTKKNEIAAAASMLGKVGARMIGFVINGVHLPQSHEGYYYQQPETKKKHKQKAVNH